MTRAARIWKELSHGTPGRRFHDHWRRRHDRHPGARKLLYFVAGALLIATGLALVLTPGPGMLFILAGAALLATQSRYAARVLDRLELALRAAAARLATRRTSRPRPPP